MCDWFALLDLCPGSTEQPILVYDPPGEISFQSPKTKAVSFKIPRTRLQPKSKELFKGDLRLLHSDAFQRTVDVDVGVQLNLLPVSPEVWLAGRGSHLGGKGLLMYCGVQSRFCRSSILDRFLQNLTVSLSLSVSRGPVGSSGWSDVL